MAESRIPNPLVEQFKKGGVARDLRLMAAQGVLPLKPVDFVELLHHLLSDLDAEINDAASATLSRMPEAELLPIVKDRESPPEVLGWLLHARGEATLREPLLQNTNLPDEAIRTLVHALPDTLAELVVINQVRLLRNTPLLVALESNPTLNPDQRRRLRELRETFRIDQAAQLAEPPVVAVAVVTPEPEEPEPASEMLETHSLTEAEAVARYLEDEERQDTQKLSALQKLFRMNSADKVVTALKGTREERAILIRDPNRIVCTAVLGSPKLTEAEIEAIASMKNVSDVVLRQVGNHKDWTKKYNVVANLVRNPRTPLGIAITMVSRLNPRDMRAVAVDKNVSEAVRRSAQRFLRSALEKK